MTGVTQNQADMLKDSRRQCAVDWLLAFFFPIHTMAYHQNRAEINYMVIFFLALYHTALPLVYGYLGYLVLVSVLFLWIFAFYAVFKARNVSHRYEEQQNLKLAKNDPRRVKAALMRPPRENGSNFLAYLLAVMNPSISYSITCDSRLTYFGVFLLQTILTAALLATFQVGSIVGVLISLLLTLLLPVRMAVMKVRSCRREIKEARKAKNPV